MDVGELDLHKIRFTDECHFDVEGYINKQNDRHWGRENPRELQTRTAHPARITVWCAISAYGIISPFSFNSTVKAASYKERPPWVRLATMFARPNPLRFLFLGYLKNNIYREKKATIDQLKSAISLWINSILRNAPDGFTSRIRKLMAVEGGHFEHLR